MDIDTPPFHAEDDEVIAALVKLTYNGLWEREGDLIAVYHPSGEYATSLPPALLAGLVADRTRAWNEDGKDVIKQWVADGPHDHPARPRH